MDYFIVAVATVTGLYFHGWLYVRMRRWMDRDLALSMAGENPDKQVYMLKCLEQARKLKVKRRELTAWLERQAAAFAG